MALPPNHPFTPPLIKSPLNPIMMASVNGTLPAQGCEEFDQELAKWTVLRYLTLGVIISYRVVQKMESKKGMGGKFNEFLRASKVFALHEGMGMLIYFSVSAGMDNFQIFFAKSEGGDKYCGYVDMVSLYTFAVVAFLPICAVVALAQKKLYDKDSLILKAWFVFIMVAVTVVTFEFRVYCVYELGYADWIARLLARTGHQVLIAACIPPVVDAVQSGLLILSVHCHCGSADDDTDGSESDESETHQMIGYTPTPPRRNSVMGTLLEESGSEETDESSSDDECQCPVISTPKEIKMFHEGKKAHQRAMNFKGPMPQCVGRNKFVTAKYWGMTKKQIKNFWEECQKDIQFDPNDTIQAFVNKFVKKKTATSGLGLALFVNMDDPLEANLMVSHAWIENCVEFFKTLLGKKGMHDDECAYVCFLANYQGTTEDIKDQLGDDIYDSPFSEIIKNPACQRLLVIPNEELKKDGSGLYSRLWCNWEIRAATEEGLPINFTQTAMEYFLGNPTKSSKDATCTMNDDAQLIRSAIRDLPPQTAQVHAALVCVVGVFMAYGSTVACSIFKPWWSWMFGSFVGFGVGLTITVLVDEKSRQQEGVDGYKTLDTVIRAAAKKRYTYRRLHPTKDLSSIFKYAVFFAILDLAVRALWDWDKYDDVIDSSDYRKYKMFMHLIEGSGFGFLLWPIGHVNEMGPWTGVFLVDRGDQRKYGFLIGICIALGGAIGYGIQQVLDTTNNFGRGAGAGLFFGLFLTCALKEKVGHAVILFAMFTWMIVTGVLHSVAWREVLIMCLSISGVVHAFDIEQWKTWQRLLGVISALFILVGLLFVRSFTTHFSEHDWCLCYNGTDYLPTQ